MHGIVDLGGDQIIQAVYHLKTFSHRAVECGTMEVLEASQRQHGRVNRKLYCQRSSTNEIGQIAWLGCQWQGSSQDKICRALTVKKLSQTRLNLYRDLK